MRPVLYVLSFLALIALGFWAYRENYATQAALKEVEGLQRQIVGLREALTVQRAEWGRPCSVCSTLAYGRELKS